MPIVDRHEAAVAYRVLVTGSRDWDDPAAVYEKLADAQATAHEQGCTEFIVVHGGCPGGADRHARLWTRRPDAFPGMPVIEEVHVAEWGTYGKAAGPRRNAEMVASGVQLALAFIRGGSRGATGCAGLAEKAGIPTRKYKKGDG